MNQEIFALMAHAEDLQKIAEQNQKDLASSINSNKAIVESLPKTAHKTITNVLSLEVNKAMENAKEELKKATTAFQRASYEASKATLEVKNARKTSVILHSFYLLGVAIILAFFFSIVLQFIYTDRLTELVDLQGKIKKEQATLDKLNNETWNLELVDYDGGERGIILPKGIKIERSGNIADGREAIVIR